MLCCVAAAGAVRGARPPAPALSARSRRCRGMCPRGTRLAACAPAGAGADSGQSQDGQDMTRGRKMQRRRRQPWQQRAAPCMQRCACPALCRRCVGGSGGGAHQLEGVNGGLGAGARQRAGRHALRRRDLIRIGRHHLRRRGGAGGGAGAAQQARAGGSGAAQQVRAGGCGAPTPARRQRVCNRQRRALRGSSPSRRRKLGGTCAPLSSVRSAPA